MIPDWMTITLTVFPAFAGVYVVLGVPLALGLLPRVTWQRPAVVLMTGFALGPMALTAWMFILGSLPGAQLTRVNTLIGLGVMTLGAWGWAWSRWRETTVSAAPHQPLTSGERLLIGMIGLAVALRAVIMAYWPFTAYDALWVYGYQGRLYYLTEQIPALIDYYPQFIPLQYTFGQMIFGAVDDSAARAVLPLLHLGSILAAYALGALNFNRRTGLFLAGLWALYPAVGEWARMGDLEIPLAFLVTGSAAFFFAAWQQPHPPENRRYALIAGLLLGTALWTKPTAGGFALGVVLINAVELWRVRFRWAAYQARFRVSAITGLACIPLGAGWYLRNVALGHNAIDFPPAYWYTLAERGGGQLLWYAAGLTVTVVYLWRRYDVRRRVLGGVALVMVGIVPSVLARFLPEAGPPLAVLFPSLVGLPRMGLLAWGLVLVGLFFVWQGTATLRQKPSGGVRLAGWMLLATLPYFALYFWRYSYHYRLSFAVVPLMAVPVALTLASWLSNTRVRQRGWRFRWGLAAAFFVAALPGVALPFYDPFLGWDYLYSGELSDDTAKRTSGNEALMWMVDGFRIYEAEHGEPPSVVAPGVLRLPFFFPLADIRIQQAPTRLAELDDVVYFVDSHPDGTGAYEGIPLQQNQVLSALGRQDIMRKAWGKDDGIFRYEIYELHLSNRFEPPTPVAATTEDITFGGFARLHGHDLVSDVFEIGQRRVMKLFWEVLQPPQNDYMIYIHLRDESGQVWQAWDGPVGLTEDGRYYYSTLVWEPGEYITDERGFRLTNTDVPPGENYQLVVGMYDLASEERVTMSINGVPAGDGYNLGETIRVIPPQG